MDHTAEKVIFLVDGDKLKVYWNLSIFVLLNYCIYVTSLTVLGFCLEACKVLKGRF